MSTRDFEEQKAVGAADPDRQMAAIRRLLPGCADVRRASAEQDRRGVDWLARLAGGAEVGVDAKTREKGCSRYWSGGEPELSLETWSVIPEPQRNVKGKVGWTLSESSRTDYTLHLFDPSDSREVFLLPYQLLRAAFARSRDNWRTRFRTAQQDSGSWKSECVFVPAAVVVAAITEEMRSGSGGSAAKPEVPIVEQKPFAPKVGARDILQQIPVDHRTPTVIMLMLDAEQLGPLYAADLVKQVREWFAARGR